jgi:nicotinic acid phosphoribosyltransferase
METTYPIIRSLLDTDLYKFTMCQAPSLTQLTGVSAL